MTGPDPRRLILLRHGRTAYNEAGRVQGQLDVPLDDEGLRQAAAAARALVGEFSQVVSSDLERAVVTATSVAAPSGLAVAVDPRLRELDLGSWQGLTLEEIARRWPADYRAWRDGADVARGGGETYADAGARSGACLRECLTDLPAGATLLAVSHGGTARAALGVLLGLAQASWWVLGPLGNACWSVLVEEEHGWRLLRHNVAAGGATDPLAGAHDLGARPAERPSAHPVK